MDETTRTAHASTQAFGLALMAAAILVVAVITLILFGGGDAIFFGIMATIAVAGVVVLRRFDKLWARILGIVVTVALAMGAFFLAFGVFQVFSPLEFIVGLAFLLGFFLSLVGGIMALVAGRKDKPGPTEGETRLRKVTVSVIGFAAVVSIVGFFLTKSTVSDAEAAGAAPLEMVDFEFEPFTSSISGGENVLVSNSDAFAHDFTLEALDIYVYVGPGSEAIVDLGSAAPGTYDYFCSLHSDGVEGMRGSITIES